MAAADMPTEDATQLAPAGGASAEGGGGGHEAGASPSSTDKAGAREGAEAGAWAGAGAGKSTPVEQEQQQGQDEEEDYDDDLLLLDFGVLQKEAADATKQTASALSQRKKVQCELEMVMGGSKMSEIARAKPPPKGKPPKPAATKAAKAAASVEVEAAEEPTTTQDGQGSTPGSPGAASASSSSSSARASRGGKGEKGAEEEGDDDGAEESGPDEFEEGYVPKPVSDVRLLQWTQWKAGCWLPCQELTAQEASLLNVDEHDFLDDSNVLVMFFPKKSHEKYELGYYPRTKLCPFNWDPFAAAPAPGAPSPAASATKQLQRRRLAAPSPLTAAIDGDGDSALLHWTPALLTVEGQADVRAYLKDPEKWEAKKAAAAKEQEGGAGKPGRKKRGKASTGGGNGYTGPQWERMMGYAAETLRLTVEAQREKRRQSMARKAEEAALLAEEGLDDDEEEDGDDDKGAVDEALGSALATEEEGGRRGGRANVKLSVGDKVLYKPLHKKDFEEDVIVELKSTKVDDEFPVKLYGGDLLDRDMMIEKVAVFKARSKTWAPVDAKQRRLMPVGDHMLPEKTAKANQALWDVLGGRLQEKAKATVDKAAVDMKELAKRLEREDDPMEEEDGEDMEAVAPAPAPAAKDATEEEEQQQQQRRRRGPKGKRRGRGGGGGRRRGGGKKQPATAATEPPLELSPADSTSPLPARKGGRKSPQKPQEAQEEEEEEEEQGRWEPVSFSPPPSRKEKAEAEEGQKQGLDDSSYMEEDTDEEEGLTAEHPADEGQKAGLPEAEAEVEPEAEAPQEAAAATAKEEGPTAATTAAAASSSPGKRAQENEPLKERRSKRSRK